MDPIDTILRLRPAAKILILLLVIGVVVVLYWQFLYRPVIGQVKSLEPELARYKAELSTKKAIVKEKPRYEAELEETRHKLIIALKQLPDKSEIPSLLENVSALGKASGLEFILFRPQKEVSKNFYAEIPVDIKVEGAYRDIVAFFDKVSRMPRIVNMSNIVMSSPKMVPSGDMILATSCNAITYKFLEEAEKNE